MPKIDTPDEQTSRIMMQNGLDPDKFAVRFQDESRIVLVNYKTRDDIIISQGDKPWARRT